MNAHFKNMLTTEITNLSKSVDFKYVTESEIIINYEPKIRHHSAIILFGNNLSGIRTPYHVAEAGHPTTDTF